MYFIHIILTNLYFGNINIWNQKQEMGKKMPSSRKASSNAKENTKSLETPQEQQLEASFKMKSATIRASITATEERWKQYGSMMEEETLEETNQADQLNYIVKDLVSKNKVNTRNAFEVPVIDVSTLKDVRKDQFWSTISNTLENGSKVYGLRVDSMAERVQKISNEIMRSQQLNKPNEIQQPTPSTPNRQFITSELSNSTQVDLNVHLRENDNNQGLQWRKLPSQTSYETLNMRRRMDQHGISGMLMNNLPINVNLNLDILPGISFNPPRPNAHLNSKLSAQPFGSIEIFREIQLFRVKAGIQQNDIDLEVEEAQKDPLLAESLIQFNNGYLNPLDASNHCNVEEESHQQKRTRVLQCKQFESEPSIFQAHGNQQLNSFSQLDIQKVCAEKVSGQTKRQRKSARTENFENARQQKEKTNRRKINFEEYEVQERDQIMKKAVTKATSLTPDQITDRNLQPISYSSLELQNVDQNREQRLFLVPDAAKEDPPLLQGHCGDDAEIKNLHTQHPSRDSNNFNYSCLPTTNIKKTSEIMANLISKRQQIGLYELHAQYELQAGPLSMAVGFLAVLHLCNSHGLEMSENEEGEPIIFNPAYENGGENALKPLI